MLIRARDDTVPPDFLVVPDLPRDQRSFAYPDRLEPLLNAGLTATLQAVPPSDPRAVRTRRLPAAPDSLTRLTIETTDSALAALARAAFRAAAPQRYSPDRVLAAVDRLYATGFTEAVWPRVDATDTIAADSDGRTGAHAALAVRIAARPRNTLDLTVGYETDRGAHLAAAVQRRFGFLRAPAQLEAAAEVSELQHWAALSLRRASVALVPLAMEAGGYYARNDARFIPEAAGTSERRVDRGGAWTGLEYRNVFPDRVITASFHVEYITVDDTALGTSFGPLLRFTIPTPVARPVGVPTSVLLEWRFGDVHYQHVAARGALRAAIGNLHLAAVGDLALSDADAPPDVLPALGDGRAMPGLRWGQMRGPARLVGGFDFAYPVPMQGYARLRLRAGAVAPRFSQLDQSRWLTGAELGATWSIPLGPLFVGVGVNSRGRPRVDVILGPEF
jgi:hypothetical protein